MKPRRVDYDAISHLYDSQPHRTKTVDPELLALMSQRTGDARLSILDIACGTGNQLVANRSVVPFDRLVGLDRSQGMLRQARAKAPSITWIGADAAALPFRDGSFDFISCQFAFHHIEDKTRMLQEGFRILRAEGCLVLRNLCPQECPDWLYYYYFPEARVRDFEDFWPPDAVITAMRDCGFGPVRAEREHRYFEEDLLSCLETVQRRDTCSQLLAISDNAYEAGLRRLTRELASRSGPVLRDNHLCLVTFRGEKHEIES